MKFAHIADAHIGSWRDPKLKESGLKVFTNAADICIEQKVDFILICGDLFNTSLPSIDNLKGATKKLYELKQKGIPVYIIPGSHDFSPSGKTILEVLENAGLVKNVFKGEIKVDTLYLEFTIDKKTGAKITGILGKKGMLEKSYYEKLDNSSLEKKEGFKIFMFHTTLTELKPEELEMIDSAPISILPKDFDYYAGGHLHERIERSFEKGKIVYPGALFPNNFKELEKHKKGGFYIYDNGYLTYHPVELYNIKSIMIDCSEKSPQEIRTKILNETKNIEIKENTIIITLRLYGRINGKINDIDFKEIFDRLYEKGAYFVMKNTNKLTTKEFEEIKISKEDTNEIEEELIKKHIGKIKIMGNEEELTKELMKVFDIEKNEDERAVDFEERIKNRFRKVKIID